MLIRKKIKITAIEMLKIFTVTIIFINIYSSEKINCQKISSIDRFAPLEKPELQKQSWVTNSTKKILKNRNRFFSKWVQNSTELNKLKCSQARNLATKVIRSEKRVCYDIKV